MKLSDFMRGLEILRPHYEGGDGYHLGAEHDQFYAYATATPLSDVEVAEIKALGWFQPELDGNNDNDEGNGAPYDPEEGWSAFV